VSANGLTLSGARAGQVVVLTRPLGTALLGDAAGAAGRAPVDELEAAAVAAGVASGTRVGERGLLGHLHDLLDESGVGAALRVDRVPVLDGALQAAESPARPEGYEANEAWSADHVEFHPQVIDAARVVMIAPEVDGGLVLAVDRGPLQAVMAALAATGARPLAIGQLIEEPVGRIGVVTPVDRLGVTGGGSRTAKRRDAPPPGSVPPGMPPGMPGAPPGMPGIPPGGLPGTPGMPPAAPPPGRGQG
jgi:selenophosphate synthase